MFKNVGLKQGGFVSRATLLDTITDVLLHGNYLKYLVISGNNFLLQREHGSGYPSISLDATTITPLDL